MRAECGNSAHLEESKIAAVPLLPQRLAHHDIVDRQQVLARLLCLVMLSATHAHAQILVHGTLYIVNMLSAHVTQRARTLWAWAGCIGDRVSRLAARGNAKLNLALYHKQQQALPLARLGLRL